MMPPGMYDMSSSKLLAVVSGVGAVGAVGGKLLASMPVIGPDILPVIGAAAGVGIAIVWQIATVNRDRARDALVGEIEMLQKIIGRRDTMISDRDAMIDRLHTSHSEGLLEIERLNVKMARIEELRKDGVIARRLDTIMGGETTGPEGGRKLERLTSNPPDAKGEGADGPKNSG